MNTPVDRHCLRDSRVCSYWRYTPIKSGCSTPSVGEIYGHRLTHNNNLREIIPAVLEKEKEKLWSELETVKEASVIFDGTTRMDDALAIVIRFVQEDFKPTQRLLQLEVLAKAL